MSRKNKRRKLLKKMLEVKIRKPIAPPSIRHKSKKDYDRKIEKKVSTEE